MVTPFDEDGGSTSEPRGLARHLIENGSHGVVVAGTTGESPTLCDEEKMALLRAVKDELGDEATVIAGTGSNDTRHSVELTEAAAEAGADAALVVTPYYNKPNGAGILAHFEAVADGRRHCRCPLQHPLAGGDQHRRPTCSPSWREIDNVVAVKQANDDELGPIEGLDVLAGNDDVFLRSAGVSAAPAGSSSPRTWSATDAGDVGRRAGGRHRPGARDRRRAAADLRGDDGDHQPDPGQGGARDARADRRRPACGCRWSRPTTSSGPRSGRRSRRTGC